MYRSISKMTMSKVTFDIESQNYRKNVMKWFYSIETNYNPKQHEVGESHYAIKTNMPPFKDMVIDYTYVNGKSAVVLQYPASSVAKARGIKPTIKIYYPKHVEEAFHDYDETGKYMYSAKVDDIFWFYEERFRGLRAEFGGVITSFGMDMSMPFLSQQDWKECELA